MWTTWRSFGFCGGLAEEAHDSLRTLVVAVQRPQPFDVPYDILVQHAQDGLDIAPVKGVVRLP